MDADLLGLISGPVPSIFSAQSPGPAAVSSQLKENPETRGMLEAAIGNSTREVFEIIVGASLGPADQASLPKIADYTAVVGLAGDLCGLLSFRCATPSAHRIAAQMLGGDEVPSEECVRDALGEICNMVVGSFKAQISDLAHQCMLSIPTVITGKDYQLHPMADGARVQVAMSFHDAPVWITLDLHS